jgi:hypothetical protein
MNDKEKRWRQRFLTAVKMVKDEYYNAISQVYLYLGARI